MKSWSSIYNKYKDTELMDEFGKYAKSRITEIDNYGKISTSRGFMAYNDIKDILGYLICFAETKGIKFEDRLIIIKDVTEEAIKLENVYRTLASDLGKPTTAESDMLWCADKFFEEKK